MSKKYKIKEKIDEKEFQKLIDESNKRIKEVYAKTKIVPLDLLRTFD